MRFTLLAGAAAILCSSVAHAGPAENKVTALAFYDALIVSKKGAAAAKQYLAPNFRSHSPGFSKGNADEFLGPADDAMKNPSSTIAQWHVDVRHAVAEGDLVFIHARARVGPKTYVLVDILRFEKGKIAEHWDDEQDVTDSKNKNGTF